MAWMIVQDHFNEGSAGDAPHSNVGRQQNNVTGYDGLEETLKLKDLPLRCKLYDDDGELYYTVAYDQWAEDNDQMYGGLYQLYKWGEWDSGTTDLRIKGKSIYG